jgi:hypothetical protein
MKPDDFLEQQVNGVSQTPMIVFSMACLRIGEDSLFLDRLRRWGQGEKGKIWWWDGPQVPAVAQRWGVWQAAILHESYHVGKELKCAAVTPLGQPNQICSVLDCRS